MRDWQKDLETCNNATPGPWYIASAIVWRCTICGQVVINDIGTTQEKCCGCKRKINRWVSPQSKAEALNLELIEALDFLLHRKYTGDTEERILGAARLLAKAKREVE